MLLIEPQEGRVPSQESWRIFCAIPMSDHHRERVMRHVERLRAALPSAHASWSRKENMHLTLKFLGGLPVSHVCELSSAVGRAVEGFSTFEICLEETGVFPKNGLPRVLWIGVKDDSGKLAELNARLEDEGAKVGFAREERFFHPHLTVARLRHREGAHALAAAHRAMHFEPVKVVASGLLVIRSELNSEGSKYSVISSHSLSVPTSA